MERKTIKQFLKPIITFFDNDKDKYIPLKDAEEEMQAYADQEMALFAEWKEKRYTFSFVVGKYILRSQYKEAMRHINHGYKPEKLNVQWLTTQQLLTIYKKEQDGNKV